MGDGLMRFRAKLNFLTMISVCGFALLQCTGVTPGGGLGASGPGAALDGGGLGGNPAAPVGQPVEDFTPRDLPEYVRFKVVPLAQVRPGSSIQWDGMDDLQVAPANPAADEDGPLVVDTGNLPTQVDPGEYAYGPKPYVWYRHQDNPYLSSWAFQTDAYGTKTLLIAYPKSEGTCEHHFTFHSCWVAGDGQIWEAKTVSASCPEGKYDDPFEVTLELIPSDEDIECPPPNPY
jgi:hypothetical protein